MSTGLSPSHHKASRSRPSTRDQYRLSAGDIIELEEGGGAVITVQGDATVTPQTGVVQPFALTDAPYDGYVFDVGHENPSFATVSVRGVGTAGDSIQVFLEATQGGENSSIVTTQVAEDGTWTAHIPRLRETWDQWYRPQARVQGDGSWQVATNLVGLGHKVGVWGQSELAYFLRSHSFYQQTPRTYLPTEGLTLVQNDSEGDAASDIDTIRVTQANYQAVNSSGGAAMTTGILSAYCAFDRAVPGRKWEISDFAEPGTNVFPLMDDDDGARAFSRFLSVLDLVQSGGSPLGLLILNWVNSPAASLPTMLQDWAVLMFGQLASGAAYTLGDANVEGVTQSTRTYEHMLWDIEAPADEVGRGVFARGRTKLALMLPLPFADTGTQEDFAYDNSLRVARSSREGIEAFAADSRVQTFLQGLGPSTHQRWSGRWPQHRQPCRPKPAAATLATRNRCGNDPQWCAASDLECRCSGGRCDAVRSSLAGRCAVRQRWHRSYVGRTPDRLRRSGDALP